MCAGEKCTWIARAGVTVVLVVLLTGCPSNGQRIAQPPDTSFLAEPDVKENIIFRITFAHYDAVQEDIVEEAWAAASRPASDVDALWRANGLRVAAADRSAARRLRAALKRVTTLVARRREMVIPSDRSFDVAIGTEVPSAGLVYKLRDETAYIDAQNLQVLLKVIVAGRGKDSRICLTPFFRQGIGGREETALEGLEAVFGFSKGKIFLVGATTDPADMRLGTFLNEKKDARRQRTLVIIEPSLSY